MAVIKHLDLFSGIGGFTLGLKQADSNFYKTIAFCEINQYCQKVLQKNFPNVPIVSDIKTLNAKSFKCDLITAGFPCQDLSVAGKRKGLKGERSGLFYETIRVAKETKAEFILYENSPELIWRDNHRKEFIETLQKNGFCALWRICSADELGFLHKRKRAYILCFKETFTNTNVFGRIFLEALQRCYSNESRWQPSPQTIYIHSRYIHRCKRRDFETNCRDIRRDDGFPIILDAIEGLGNAVIPKIVKIWGKALKQTINTTKEKK